MKQGTNIAHNIMGGLHVIAIFHLIRRVHITSTLQAIDLLALRDKVINIHVHTKKGHPSSNLTKSLLRYIHGISLGPMRLIFVELLCLQGKIANFHVEIDPITSKNRSRSSIFELNQDTPRIHPWYKFGPNAITICWVIVFTSKMLTDRRTDTPI